MALKVWGAGSASGTDMDWDNAANWTDDTPPTTNDDVLFDSTTANSCSYGPASAITLDSLIIDAAYTGVVGLTNTILSAEAGVVTINNSLENHSIAVSGLSIRLTLNSVTSWVPSSYAPDMYTMYGDSTVAAGTYTLTFPTAFNLPTSSSSTITFDGDTVLNGGMQFNNNTIAGNISLTITSLGTLTLSSFGVYMANLNTTISSPYLIFNSANGTFLNFDAAIQIEGTDGAGFDRIGYRGLQFWNVSELIFKDMVNYVGEYQYFQLNSSCSEVVFDNVQMSGSSFEGMINNRSRSMLIDCNANNAKIVAKNASILYLTQSNTSGTGLGDSAYNMDWPGISITNLSINNRIEVHDTSELKGIILEPSSPGATTQARGLMMGGTLYQTQDYLPEIVFYGNSKFIGHLTFLLSDTYFKLYDKAVIAGDVYMDNGQVNYVSPSYSIFKNSSKSSF